MQRIVACDVNLRENRMDRINRRAQTINLLAELNPRHRAELGNCNINKKKQATL